MSVRLDFSSSETGAFIQTEPLSIAVVDINACHFVVEELHKKINDASRHINLTMRFKFKLMMMCKKLSSGFKRGRDSKDRTLQYLGNSDGSGLDGFGWMSTIRVFESNMVILYNF